MTEGEQQPRSAWASLTAFLREFFDFSGDNALPFTLTDDDVRIERGEWVYYVRAVHRGKLLKQDLTPINVLSLLVYLVLCGFVDDWRARRPWKLGVLRRRGRGAWRLELLHKEVLEPGTAPDGRRAELVEAVNAGRYDTT